MKRWLYLVIAITLIAAFGFIFIGCRGCTSGPSNADIKKAVIALEQNEGIHLTQEDIEIVEVGMLRIVPLGVGSTVAYYPVTVSIYGHEVWYRIQKAEGEWIALRP